MTSNNGFALLVGVDDYSSYDAAASLKGSREDVLKLYWFCTKLLGLAPENIRVLASPPLSPADFYATEPPPPDALGPATSEAIQEGIQWLAERMASDGAAAGLFTFSGHGSYARGRGPLLCPTDVGRDLAKGIAVRDLSKMDALQKVRERLTVVLDCCHHAPEAPAPDLRIHTALPHDATPEEVAADHADFDISERVLLAARPGQQAHQALLGKVFHGALTFALVTVAEQWKASQAPKSSGMLVSYKQLLKRVRKLLWSLRMKQSTRLRVPLDKRKAVRELPFFGTHAALTARRPDAVRDRLQLDPNFYTIRLNSSDGPILAQVVAMGTFDVNVVWSNRSKQTFGNKYYNQEIWYVEQSAIATLASATAIHISSVALETELFLDSSIGLGDATTGFTSWEFGQWKTSAVTFPGFPSYYFKLTGKPTKPTGATAVWLQLSVGKTSTGTLQLIGVQWYLIGLASAPSSTSPVLDPSSETDYKAFPGEDYYSLTSLATTPTS